MDGRIILLALAVNAAAIFCFYLSVERQQWLAQPLPARPGRWAGSILMLGAVLLWWSQATFSTMLFAVLTISMLLGSLVPYLAALRTILKGRQP
ncbi:hypothetical protein MJ904_11755 [Massilia sp. MB5]|uniref:hypothetical protein n=1 Tax=unclassified Massilia TaxID=2609279 RepID=UPI00067B337B|nr:MULTISPECIES: hypothetical protein [unclassified Massilia]AKU22445.1 hypothetical protein ACZ75_14180 [Massilia sp. NR 4-1]UMR32771.1 hypothetical protein MJ904_11755 [Massilia sp. MB5]